MDQLIFILIIGGIALVNWLLKKGTSKVKNMTEQIERRQQPQSQSQNAPPDSEEERMRRFFEALGLPPGSAPPPKVQRRTQPPALPSRPAPPRRPVFEGQQEVARRAQNPVERTQRRAQPQTSTPVRYETPTPAQTRTAEAEPVSVQPIFAAAEAIAKSAQVTDKFPSAASPAAAPAQHSDLLAMLRSSSSIRNAVLLREILGAPRGLQSGFEPHTFPLS